MWSAEGQAQSLRNICWKQAIEQVCFGITVGMMGLHEVAVINP